MKKLEKYKLDLNHNKFIIGGLMSMDETQAQAAGYDELNHGLGFSTGSAGAGGSFIKEAAKKYLPVIRDAIIGSAAYDIAKTGIQNFINSGPSNWPNGPHDSSHFGSKGPKL